MRVTDANWRQHLHTHFGIAPCAWRAWRDGSWRMRIGGIRITVRPSAHAVLMTGGVDCAGIWSLQDNCTWRDFHQRFQKLRAVLEYRRSLG